MIEDIGGSEEEEAGALEGISGWDDVGNAEGSGRKAGGDVAEDGRVTDKVG